MLHMACPKYYLLSPPFLFTLFYLVNHICKSLISVFLCLQTIIFVPDRQLMVVTLFLKNFQFLKKLSGVLESFTKQNFVFRSYALLVALRKCLSTLLCILL